MRIERERFLRAGPYERTVPKTAGHDGDAFRSLGLRNAR